MDSTRVFGWPLYNQRVSHRIARRVFLAAGLMAGGASLGAWLLHRPEPATLAAPMHLGSVNVVPRAGWGATPPNFGNRVERGLYDPVFNRGGWRVYDKPLVDVLRTIIVHHSAMAVSAGPREIQSLHQNERGYADIGYHFLIDAAGNVFEGREIGVRGVHTGGFNTGSVGICLLGNFERVAPTAAQINQLVALAAALRDAYRMTHLAGHRDFQPKVTVCPGAQLAPRLPALASENGLIFGTDGYTGS